MEFEIDFPLVRTIISAEVAQAREEIAQLGIVAAYRNSLARMDALLAAAPDAGTLACKAGCSWCCYFSVDARPVEIFNILDLLEREFSPDERARIAKEVRFNAANLSGLDEADRIRQNIKCPFLVSGRCSIYNDRPQTCRNYHATDATGCKRSFEEPENLEIDPDFAPLTYQTGVSHVDAFAEAMSEAGYDVSAYELNTAIAAALADPQGARLRFENKSKPFTELQGQEVEAEFSEAFGHDT